MLIKRILPKKIFIIKKVSATTTQPVKMVKAIIKPLTTKPQENQLKPLGECCCGEEYFHPNFADNRTMIRLVSMDDKQAHIEWYDTHFKDSICGERKLPLDYKVCTVKPEIPIRHLFSVGGNPDVTTTSI
jgi:hypothetical protein